MARRTRRSESGGPPWRTAPAGDGSGAGGQPAPGNHPGWAVAGTDPWDTPEPSPRDQQRNQVADQSGRARSTTPDADGVVDQARRAPSAGASPWLIDPAPPRRLDEPLTATSWSVAPPVSVRGAVPPEQPPEPPVPPSRFVPRADAVETGRYPDGPGESAPSAPLSTPPDGTRSSPVAPPLRSQPWTPGPGPGPEVVEPATPQTVNGSAVNGSAHHAATVDTERVPSASRTPAAAATSLRVGGKRSPRELLERSLAALEPVSDGEAATFAAQFAADYLSFDEDDPTLRAQVLREYLADPAAARLGWSGRGRQRAEFVVPGRNLRTDDGVVVVEITARVLVYRRSSQPADAASNRDRGEPGQAPASAIGRSCAPPPAGPGWVGDAAHWVQIAPPVRRHRTGRLVIDLGAPPSVDEPGTTR